MDLSVPDPRPIWVGRMDVGSIIPGGGSGCLNIWVGDEVGDPLHQQDARFFSPQGGPTVYGEAKLEVNKWKMVLPPPL